ncbi:MAG TPA: DUF551 domain-containing protein [Candidatus Mediterraneibacter excrementigallinarum]|nr:DUF551 domain-containing protein [Candidatus Mediterraneibacter excrementigallinarum]
MQELEIVREKLQSKYRVVKTDEDLEWNRAIDLCTNIINAHMKHMNDGWISVDERLPEPGRIVLITQTYSWENFEEGASVTIGRLSPEKNNKMWEFQYYRPDFRSGTIMDNDIICPGSEYVIAWQPLPEPFRVERSEGE